LPKDVYDIVWECRHSELLLLVVMAFVLEVTVVTIVEIYRCILFNYKCCCFCIGFF
jgi:hypothetical protein